MNTSNPKNVWWYRLLTIIYILGYIIILSGTTIAVFSDTKPYSSYVINEQASYIQCKVDAQGGEVFTFEKNPALYAYESKNPSLTSSSHMWANETCTKRENRFQNLIPVDSKRLEEIKADLVAYRASKNDQPSVYTFEELKMRYGLEKKYEEHIVVIEDKFGSWVLTIFYVQVSILAVYIFMYLIYSAFHWVAFGEKFKTPKLIRFLNNTEN